MEPPGARQMTTFEAIVDRQERGGWMKIVCISDTHLQGWPELPDGGVLVHSGDATLRGTLDEIGMFAGRMARAPHKYKIFVAGNHDWGFQMRPAGSRAILKDFGITYLQDSGVTIDGIKFWGAPWQPWFNSWAFNLPRGEALREKWDLIPPGTDVLITHGPPFGVMDWVDRGEHVGCEELRDAVLRVEPRLHVFGHIHNGYGRSRLGRTTCVNASICSERYEPVNEPIVVELDAGPA